MLCQTQASTIQKCIFFLQSLCALIWKSCETFFAWHQSRELLPSFQRQYQNWVMRKRKSNCESSTHMRNSAHIVLGILEKLFFWSQSWRKYNKKPSAIQQCKKNSERKSSWPPNDSKIPLAMLAENFTLNALLIFCSHCEQNACHILIRILSFTLKMLKHSHSDHKSSWLHLLLPIWL